MSAKEKWIAHGCTVYTNPGFEYVAEFNPSVNPCTDTQKARARIASCAPELLAVLEDLLAVVNVRIDDPRTKQFDAARAAISKAKGLAPKDSATA